ncbi:HNH endonuclease family protein [Desulfosarcina sp. BuS5]|uniref:HNH endonuclease family protein n=1 Tax=Desulfosarcina sp. BuS5 TaxID=933262 RepID=UPI0004862A1C|nr:HNH endonuclease family protein [Desulfosarcina sp. BuS5]
MDKMKSLIFYFSNKYLEAKYDDKINNIFGEIFELYDDIKLIGEEQGINIISSKLFTEDDLLRQHHICFSEDSYDPTAQQVMDNVKLALVDYRKNGTTDELDEFITTYIDSLLNYVRAFKKIISRTTENERYYKIFSILGLSAVYYPVITQLEICGFLEKKLPSKAISVLDMIEIIDVRVFKIRDYAGKKHVAEFAYSLNHEEWTIDEIEEHLLWFNSFEISNDRFKDYLSDYDYYKQTGLLRLLFIDYCERLSKRKYTLKELKKIMDNDPTIEHILSQTPKFKPRSFGFKNNEDFDEYKNLIGNLSLLEKKINSSIKNSDLSDKVAGYSKSKFKMTQQLATLLSQTKSFKKKDLKERSQLLVEDFATRWWA